MTFTANGLRLLKATMSEPLRNAWVVDIEVDASEDIGDSITLELGDTAATCVGTKVRGDVEHGRWIGRIVGGKGGLSKEIASKYYTSVPVRTVLSDIATDSGETLDGTITDDVLGRALARWTRPKAEAKLALDDLAAELGLSWRVLRNGKIWIGSETWPVVSMPHVELSRGPSAGTLTVAPTEAPLVRPGTTFEDLKISYVVTTLNGGKLRQELYRYESNADRIWSALKSLVTQLIGNQIDYAKSWPSVVVSQSVDGTLEVVPDDERIRGLGLTRLPIRHGLPGVTVKVPKGTRVRVFFDGADPKRPYAALWDSGEVTSISFHGGTRPYARVGDPVTWFFPPQMPVSGLLNGQSFVGVLTITTPGTGMVGGGDPKLLG